MPIIFGTPKIIINGVEIAINGDLIYHKGKKVYKPYYEALFEIRRHMGDLKSIKLHSIKGKILPKGYNEKVINNYKSTINRM